MVLSVAVAIAAAFFFASGNAVQHQAAGRVPPGSLGRLVVGLLRSARWLTGSCLALTAFTLHVIALNIGAVAVVQPILVAAVLLAVFVRAALDRVLPPLVEIGWVLFTVLAIAVLVGMAHPEPSNAAPDDERAALLAVAGLSLALLWASSARRAARAAMRGFVYATASGVVFGITAGLMKFMRLDLADGWWGVAASWHVWALLAGSLAGTTLNQLAYQASRLSVCMPSMNVTNIVVAVGFGWLVFGEPPATTAGAFAVQLVCLGCTVVGLWQVARAEDEAVEDVPPSPEPAADLPAASQRELDPLG